MENMAACKFCGQFHMIKSSEEMSEEALMHEAIMECKCEEALLYQKRQDIMNYAESNVKELFSDDGDNLVAFLNSAIQGMGKGIIKKMKVTTQQGVAAELDMKTNTIKVTRTVTNKQSLES